MERSTLGILALGALAVGCGGASSACLARPDGSPAPIDDDLAVAHAEREITSGGDVCLYTQSWSPRDREPEAVVVLVHGLRDHSSRYDEAARALARRGYAVHAGDLQGHGRSGGERQFVDHLGIHVDDVRRVIEGAREAHPSRPVFVLGHSMGGAIATLLALEHPDELDGIVLSAAALELNAGTSDFDLGLAHFFAGVLPHVDATTLDGASFSRDPAVREADERDPLVIRSALPARTVSALVRAVETIRAREHDLALPMLLMHGDADRITPPGGTGRLYAEASSSDRTFRLYRGLFHDLLHEPERARVIDDILAWLDAHSTSP